MRSFVVGLLLGFALSGAGAKPQVHKEQDCPKCAKQQTHQADCLRTKPRCR